MALHWCKRFLLCLALTPTLGIAAPDRIEVVLPGPGAGGYLPIELIPSIGADRAEGVEVTLKFVGGGGVALEQLLSNNADFAVVGLPAAMSARLKDARVVAVAPVNDLPIYALLVRQALKGKVKEVADLKGRTIGVHSNSVTTKTNSHQLLELILKTHGIPVDSVRTVPVTQRWDSESSMLIAGDADAIMGDEPYATRMEEQKTAYALIHLGNPEHVKRIPGGGFLRATLITRKDLIDNNPQRVATMVRVVQRVLQWIEKQSPADIVQAAQMKDPGAAKAMVRSLTKYPRQFSRDGRFSTQQLIDTETFFHASQSSNPSAKALKIESMIDDRWAGRKH